MRGGGGPGGVDLPVNESIELGHVAGEDRASRVLVSGQCREKEGQDLAPAAGGVTSEAPSPTSASLSPSVEPFWDGSAISINSEEVSFVAPSLSSSLEEEAMVSASMREAKW
jgi:hypothetical protein